MSPAGFRERIQTRLRGHGTPAVDIIFEETACTKADHDARTGMCAPIHALTRARSCGCKLRGRHHLDSNSYCNPNADQSRNRCSASWKVRGRHDLRAGPHEPRRGGEGDLIADGAAEAGPRLSVEATRRHSVIRRYAHFPTFVTRPFVTYRVMAQCLVSRPRSRRCSRDDALACTCGHATGFGALGVPAPLCCPRGVGCPVPFGTGSTGT